MTDGEAAQPTDFDTFLVLQSLGYRVEDAFDYVLGAVFGDVGLVPERVYQVGFSHKRSSRPVVVMYDFGIVGGSRKTEKNQGVGAVSSVS